jgi:hypothetical protein
VLLAGFVKGIFGRSGSSSSVPDSDRLLIVPKVSWLRMGVLRLTLGLFGVTAGLALYALFIAMWHCASWLGLTLFGVNAHGWLYAWDVIFAAALLWNGHQYKARMPPANPFTKGETLLAIGVIGTALSTPAQAAFSISEMLYVAPRFFFWGIGHLRRVEWPSAGMARTAEQIYDALQSAGTWAPYEQLQSLGSSKEESAHALAMLVRAELAEGRFHKDGASFQKTEPEWI